MKENRRKNNGKAENEQTKKKGKEGKEMKLVHNHSFPPIIFEL